MRWTTEQLAAVSDAGSIDRGRRYAAQDRVELTSLTDDEIRSVVHGTSDYVVLVTATDGDCDCPVGVEGWFCKHCVATVYAAGVLAEASPTNLGPVADLSEFDDPAPTDHAPADEPPTDLTPDELTSAVDAGLPRRRSLDWLQASRYADDATPVFVLLKTAAYREPDLAIPALERAITRVIKVTRNADDSNGSLGDLIVALLDVHALACRRGHPDAVKLAKWIVRFSVDEQDWFAVDVNSYSEALGERGFDAYRTEIARRRAKGETDFNLDELERRLAVAERDLDAIVRLHGGALSSGWDFFKVAQAMREVGEHGRALDYVERGLPTATGLHLSRLADLAVEEYRQRGDSERILQIRRDVLRRNPSTTSYAALRAQARQMKVWDDERPAARAVMKSLPFPHEFMRALLTEKDVDAAWDWATQAAAGRQWDEAFGAVLVLNLADARAKTRPDDALPLYRRMIEITLRGADRRSYQQAIKILRRYRTAATAAHADADYLTTLAELRVTQQRRPVFMEMLARL